MVSGGVECARVGGAFVLHVSGRDNGMDAIYAVNHVDHGIIVGATRKSSCARSDYITDTCVGVTKDDGG